MRLLPYNKPYFLIFTGILAAGFSGSVQPLTGLILSKLLSIMTSPKFILEQEARETGIAGYTANDFFMDEIKYYSLLMTGLAVIAFVAVIVQKSSFGALSEKVAEDIRKILYGSILQKHIGWFDSRENSSSILTSTMAQDTSFINGVSIESLSPQIEGGFSLVIALGLGIYYSWQMSIAMVILAPILSVGGMLDMEVQKDIQLKMNENMKMANLLCGDAIINFRTVQSFGYEELIVKTYKDLLQSGSRQQTSSSFLKTGLAFGFAQITQFGGYALLLYSAGWVINQSYNEETQYYDVDPRDVFLAMFAIMMGSIHIGTATAFGPDIKKAFSAATRIFTILDTPSKIDAVEMNNDTSKIRLDLKNIQGKIEFRDVWFRYPTRKEDFVMRGLNITINPKEIVALVGESGCGKSTFVSLLMRFYDVDGGEILLDDVNIKDINLHDLRKAISLVMQEPIIFNYSILENILYGKLDATNSEVRKACEIANALEFIEKDNFGVDSIDESPINLMGLMTSNKSDIVDLIGEDKFNEEMEMLQKIEDQR